MKIAQTHVTTLSESQWLTHFNLYLGFLMEFLIHWTPRIDLLRFHFLIFLLFSSLFSLFSFFLFLKTLASPRCASTQRDAALSDLREVTVGKLLQIHGQATRVQDFSVPVLET